MELLRAETGEIVRAEGRGKVTEGNRRVKQARQRTISPHDTFGHLADFLTRSIAA